MSIISRIGRATRRALALRALGATVALPAMADEPESSAAPVIQEVVVTGSRIKGVTNADSASPVSVVTAEEISMPKAANIEDALSRMTGVTMSTTLASNNGGGGSSSVALRGLGPERLPP